MNARMKQSVTLRDIAKVAGVSAQTVSCVVNNTGSVSEALRIRVREIADKLGYAPNMYAKAMRTGRSHTIGLVISDIRRPFFPELAHELQRATRKAGYSLVIVDTEDSPDQVQERVSVLRRLGVDGIITTEALPAVFDLGIPSVMLGASHRGRDSVTADDAAGGVILAEHLLSHGHRKIGLVTSPLEGCVQVRRETLIGRLAGHAEVVWEIVTPLTEVITAEVRNKLRMREMTAVVCSHDLIAIGILRALRDLGILVPEEVSVVGFDDVQWASIVSPSLTTVRQPYASLADEAFTLLLERIDKPNRKARHLKLGVQLVERESVGAAAGKIIQSRSAAAVSRRVPQPVRP
jgi:LacI family transcriptional regulator